MARIGAGHYGMADNLLVPLLLFLTAVPLAPRGTSSMVEARLTTGNPESGGHQVQTPAIDSSLLRHQPESHAQIFVKKCPKGCICHWEQNSLTGLSCNSACDEFEIRHQFPASYWSHLEQVVLDGGKAYSCVASMAFKNAYHILRSLNVTFYPTDDPEDNIFDDISYLHNLQHLRLSDITTPFDVAEPTNLLPGLEKLEKLELARVGNLTKLNLAALANWPRLSQLTLTRCPELRDVIYHDISDDSGEDSGDSDVPYPDLLHLDLSDNPGLARVCPWALRSAPNLVTLDLSGNPGLVLYPSVLQPLAHLGRVDLDKSSFNCDCHISIPQMPAWLDELMDRECLLDPGSGSKYSSLARYLNESCHEEDDGFALSVVEDVMSSQVATVNSPVALDCLSNETGVLPEYVAWVTPIHEVRVSNLRENQAGSCEPRHQLFEDPCVPVDEQLILSRVVYFSGGHDHIRVEGNSSLVINDFGWRDRGLYRCYVWSRSPDGSVQVLGNATHRVDLDVGYRQRLYHVSLIYGVATASGFLLITLLAKFIYWFTHNYGCCLFCCCCKNQLPPKAKRLKNALDVIEAYRGQQQEKLRENYHQQTEWIRNNCAQQMERVRENYNGQIQNLKDIRLAGGAHLHAVRDQYYEQMHRIRDYSANHLERVHENYIFQRQKLREFSAQNYLKMRETSKYTRRTVNKVMETLPSLYLDLTACRQGLNGSQQRHGGSLEWEKDEFDHIVDLQVPLAPPPPGIDLGMITHSKSYTFADGLGSERRSDSVYFTPSGTPQRPSQAHPRSSSLTKDPYKAVYGYSQQQRQQHDNPASSSQTASTAETKPFIKNHGKSKSFSFNFLPSYWFGGGGANVPNSVSGLDSSVLHHAVIEHEPCSDDYFQHPIEEDAPELEGQTDPDKVDVMVEEVAMGNSLDDSGKDITPSTISTSAGAVPPTQVDETSSESAIVADMSPSSDLKQLGSCSEANLVVSGTENNLMSSPLLKCHKKQRSF